MMSLYSLSAQHGSELFSSLCTDKLDGLGGSGKRKREDVGLDDYLQLPDDYATRMSEPGKKRVMLGCGTERGPC